MTKQTSLVVNMNHLMSELVTSGTKDSKNVKKVLKDVGDSSEIAVSVCKAIIKRCYDGITAIDDDDGSEQALDPIMKMKLVEAYNCTLAKALKSMQLAHHEYLSSKYVPKGNIAIRDLVNARAIAASGKRGILDSPQLNPAVLGGKVSEIDITEVEDADDGR